MADCYDQATLESSVRSEDPAMVNVVETPSGECELTQRTETRSHRRNEVPVKRGKAHENLKNDSLSEAGDSSREKGGTQEFLTVHSQL